MWNLKNKTNEQRNKLLTIENKPVITREDVGGGGMGNIGEGN